MTAIRKILLVLTSGAFVAGGLSGCENDLEDAVDDVGDEIEEVGDEVEDAVD